MYPRYNFKYNIFKDKRYLMKNYIIILIIMSIAFQILAENCGVIDLSWY